MPSLRLCSHIKTNGVKCGSPALRHNTLCYFHYQWQRRDQRRIRLGGPIGMNKNSGIELPLLDGPEAILVSIMEIQHAIVDQRIPVKTATALLYSLQLALQAKISAFGPGHSSSVRECPELNDDLEMERAKAMRPAKEKCAACPTQDDCTSARNCKKLPKLPPGYRRSGDRLVRDPDVPAPVPAETLRPDPTDAPDFCHAEERRDEASLSRAQPSTAIDGPASQTPASPQPCHPERSNAASEMRHCVAEGPCVSSPEAPIPNPTTIPEATTDSSFRAKVATAVEGPASRSSVPPIIGSSVASISHAHCILGSNPHPHIDLGRKSPQLAETKRAES